MKKLFIVAFFVLAFYSANASAEGYLFVSPQRLDLDQRNKIGQLHLVNKSESPKAYEIKLVNYKMGEKGSLERVEEMPHSAKGFLRYSPRRVTLQPQEDQYIRVMARMPRTLEDGGYHTHVEFNEVEGAFSRKSQDKTDNNQVSFEIASTYSVAVPVFVTKGEISANADIIDVSTDIKSGSNKGAAFVKIRRNGNSTSYNLLKIFYIDSNGKVHIATTPAKTSVYREIDEINRRFQLNLPEGVKFSGGKIKVAIYPIDSKDEGSPLDEVITDIN